MKKIVFYFIIYTYVYVCLRVPSNPLIKYN